jgi:hypothetical protein
VETSERAAENALEAEKAKTAETLKAEKATGTTPEAETATEVEKAEAAETSDAEKAESTEELGDEVSKYEEFRFTVELMERLVKHMENTHVSLHGGECEWPAGLIERLRNHMKLKQEELGSDFSV